MSSTPLGARIRELRGKRLMLQRDLAHQVGLKRNSMTQIESGRDIPSALTICKIAEVLHADANELLCLAGKVPTNLTKRMAGNALLAELISVLCEQEMSESTLRFLLMLARDEAAIVGMAVQA